MARYRTLAVAVLALLLPRPATCDEAARAGEWQVECRGEGNAKCVAVHDVLVKTADQPDAPTNRILRATIAKSDQGQMVLLALLPLGIFLPAGVVSTVDEAPQTPMTVQRCTQAGCEAAQALTPETFQALRKGKQLKVAFKADPNGQTLVVEVPLKHAAAALDKVK